MTSTRARRAALRELLRAGGEGTQDELAAALAERGFSVTQSTVSRDLKALDARRRTRPEGGVVYRLGDGDGPGRAVGSAGGLTPGMVRAVEHNEVMVVVRTRIGRAQAVGLDLDAMAHPEVLGTLAGDDTVLVVPRSVERTAELAEALRSLAGLEEA